MTSTTAPPPESAGGRTDLPPLDVLLPAAEHLPPDPREERLAALYAYGPSARGAHVVRANMVASVDGAAWGPDHRSGSINDDADWRVFRVLRALADVVLVGAGTGRAEGYTALDRPRGLRHLHDAPLELAIVTRTGRVPEALARGDRPPLVLTGPAGAATARGDVPADRVLVVGQDAAGAPPQPGAAVDLAVDLTRGLAALADRGLARVLTEGGPTLLGDLLAADLVDELCVTTTPTVVGQGPGRIVAGAAPSGTTALPPRGARLAHLLHSPEDRPGSPAGTTAARWLLPIG
ncbi:riboflavin biosynthesis pyrimidine reductase [Cellulosimicrobium cellulans]|uniref:dihydrofolate reductase family protein n=1 Tax=Cellulosimicrobium cellulans TaxID=1710 RepID=UPI0027DC3D2E|nr:dihydrofolate reductase family protein [Cellulosimicrobium cellulans]MBM7819765.1 riboflavin biosynthesis pyrimidine reductase [Cellulosimicrobium cellulans]